MIRLLVFLCAFFAATFLSGCDYFVLEKLQPGVSTALDVRDNFGAPGMVWRNDDGSVTWEYSRQPLGTTCYMITIGPDDVLRGIDQVLDEDGFARVRRGMTGDEVRRVLGKPASSEYLQLSRETVWSWRIEAPASASDSLFFTVHFNADGRVSRTGRNVEYRGG